AETGHVRIRPRTCHSNASPRTISATEISPPAMAISPFVVTFIRHPLPAPVGRASATGPSWTAGCVHGCRPSGGRDRQSIGGEHLRSLRDLPWVRHGSD